MNRWFVVSTKSRAEHMAFAHLDRQGFEVYLPRFLKRRKHARRVDTVAAPLFPRYMFVKMDPAQVRWRAIRSTVGVVDLVGYGDSPTAVPEGVIEEIQRRENDAGMVSPQIADMFKPGDSVCVNSGAFDDVNGIFECATDDARVVVLLDLLGRKVKVHVPTEAIRAAS